MWQNLASLWLGKSKHLISVKYKIYSLPTLVCSFFSYLIFNFSLFSTKMLQWKYYFSLNSSFSFVLFCSWTELLLWHCLSHCWGYSCSVTGMSLYVKEFGIPRDVPLQYRFSGDMHFMFLTSLLHLLSFPQNRKGKNSLSAIMSFTFFFFPTMKQNK